MPISQMTPGQARVVDPILTTVAQGYKNGLMVADFLFPVVPVDQRGGKIIQFGKEDFKLFSTIRAPGANTKRVQYGYAGDPYSLDQHALEAVVPFEIQGEASAVPGSLQGRPPAPEDSGELQVHQPRFRDRRNAGSPLERGAGGGGRRGL